MQTVITSRPAALASGASAGPDPSTEVEDDGPTNEDFAALVSEGPAETAVPETALRPDMPPMPLPVPVTFWSGGMSVDGETATGTAAADPGAVGQDPVVAPGQAGPELAFIAVGSADPQVNAGETGPIRLAVAAAQLGATSARHLVDGAQTAAVDAPMPEQIGEARSVLPDVWPVDLPAPSQVAAAPSDMAVIARVLGTPKATTLLESVGLRLWQGAFLADEAPQADDASQVDRLTDLTTLDLAPLLAGLRKVPVANPAETALLSMVAVQAEATMQDDAAMAFGFTPSANHTSFAPLLATVAQAAAVPHLAAQLVQTLSQHDDGTTEIALSPDELGRVRVTMQPDATNPDRLVVMLNFERPETLDLFRRHADQLAEALRDAGFAGAQIGFGQSDSGGNGPAQDKAGPAEIPDHEPVPTALPDHRPLRLASSSALDLRL